METAPIKLAPEQERALELMLSGKNVFLTGEAGTGKSTILREFREKCTHECVFLAPTGIAESAVRVELPVGALHGGVKRLQVDGDVGGGVHKIQPAGSDLENSSDIWRVTLWRISHPAGGVLHHL